MKGVFGLFPQALNDKARRDWGEQKKKRKTTVRWTTGREKRRYSVYSRTPIFLTSKRNEYRFVKSAVWEIGSKNCKEFEKSEVKWQCSREGKESIELSLSSKNRGFTVLWSSTFHRPLRAPYLPQGSVQNIWIPSRLLGWGGGVS